MPTFVRADFDIYITGGVDIVTEAEPENSQFLNVIKNGGPGDSPTVNWAPKVASLATQGVTNGYMTIQVTAALATASQRYGLVCMQSQRDLAPGGGGTGYFLAYSPPAGRVWFYKLTNGLRTSAVQLATAALSAAATSLSLGWVVGADDAWTLLVAITQAGEVLRYQDFSAPLVTSVTEGGCYDDGASGNNFDITFLSATMLGPP